MKLKKSFSNNKKYFRKNLPFFVVGILLPFFLLINSGQKFEITKIFRPVLQKEVVATSSTISSIAPISIALLSISKTPVGQVPIREGLLKKLDPHDPNSIFTVVDAIEADETISLNCHEIAHDIGHKAYELYGFSKAMNFTDSARLNHASISDICAGGYVHGVLEEMALDESNFKDNVGVVCQNVNDKDRASCFHGVGHALMFSYDRNVETSLSSCRNTGSSSSASRCFEGVWMELFWGAPTFNGSPLLGFDEEKPFVSCTATQNDAKPACFLYSSFGYLRKHKKDYRGAIKLCTTSGLVENDVNFCLKGVGITMNSHFKAHNLERSEIFVTGMSSMRKKAFYQGVFGYANLSGISESDLRAMCASFKNDKDICNSIIDEMY